MKFVHLILLASLALPLAAFDFGGSVDLSGSASIPSDKLDKATYSLVPTVRAWANWSFSPTTTLLFKASASDSFNFKKHTLTANLDNFVFSTTGLILGRTSFSDFGGTVLNTTLDGLKWQLTTPGFNLTTAVGTSAGLFKSGSTIIISQDDLADRAKPEDFANPATLWAAPRAVATVDATFNQIAPDQTGHLALLGQYDLRPNVQIVGAIHDAASKTETGAPVSMAYLGLGGDGRVVGPLYWSASLYGGAGKSLTPVKPDPTKPEQKWADSYIVNALASADATLLLPDLANFLLNLSVQAGSWDDDGISPDQNMALATDAKTPSLYTGYFGISRTGGSMIFNPQPVNMVTGQLLLSIKPLPVLQIAASSFAFARIIAGAKGNVTESGILTNNEENFLGFEQDVSALLRPASDWGSNLGMAVFVPNEKAGSRKMEYKVSAGLNLSF